ncbi:LOW QUALITY PROTEIN: MAPK/MAK/MRK overlapping kinase [Erethizon dorsatum]
MKNYKAIGKIGEGTFSEVLKMQSLRDGGFYACKQMKQHFDSVEQVNSLREIQALRRLNPHPNILTLHEVVFDRKSGSLALICELMENVYELIRGRRRPLSERKVTHYMYQLCKSLDHMHRNGIFHRDVKPENILIKQDVLKLGDFGSCRSVYSRQPYTGYISTCWSRAPECLLTDGCYTSKVDLWSAGCVFYEIASLQPLFPGVNELDQISKIHDVIGTPAPKTLTKFKQSRAMSFDFPFKKGSGIPLLTANLSPKCLSLLHAMVAYDPDERIAAHQALQHPYFQEQRWDPRTLPCGRDLWAGGATGLGLGYLLCPHQRCTLPGWLVGRKCGSCLPRGRSSSVAQEAHGGGSHCVVLCRATEKQARVSCSHTTFLEHLEPRDHKQQVPEGSKQKAPPRREVPACLTELPLLQLSAVTTLSSHSSPALRALKFGGTCKRVDTQDTKTDLLQCRLPTIDRKGMRY